MSTEIAYATALPRSADPAAAVHVSVFLSPKLTPDAGAPAPTLGDFAVFKDWGALVSAGRLTFTLHDDKGAMASAVVTPAPDPALWIASFPPSLPVETNRVPDWSDRDHNSFSVPLVAGVSKMLQWMTAVAAPNDPPLPTAHPLGPDFLKLIERFEGEPRRPRPRTPGRHQPPLPPDPRRFKEAEFRDVLDRAAKASRGRLLDGGASVGGDGGTSAFASLALVALHQARRYYDRPEANTVTTGSPQPHPEPPEHLAAPAPEFHRRVAAAGDHPAFLRRLGLVFDLTGDPARLAKARWIAVEVLIDGDAQHTRTLRTWVRALPGGELIADAATGTAGEALDGALPLGDPARFQTVDVDPDGSALKMDRFLGNFPRMIALQNNGDDVTAATPALRSQGFVVARIGRSDRAHDAVTAQRSLQADLAPVAAPANSPIVYADGITKGMRIEVWDDHVGRWHSLHRRLSTLTVDGYPQPVYTDEPNEGVLQGAPATETPGVEKSPIYIHESVFGWDGWSLSAPRPGRRLRNEDVPNADTPTGWEQKELPEETPDAPRPGEEPPDPFRFTHRIEPGSLPRLRFGRSYSFRAWTVDLAGHSRAHELNPQPLPPAETSSIAASASLGKLLALQRRDAVVPAAGAAAASARSVTLAAITAERARLASPPEADATVDDIGPLRGDALVAHLASRRDVRSASAAATRGAVDAAPLAGLATEALWNAVQKADGSPELDTMVRDTAAVARVVASHLATLAGPGATADAAETAQKTVTPLMPFLRWDPVPPPAVVPRAQYTEGESLRTVVIRSGVSYVDGSDVPVVTPPEDYADVLKAFATSPELTDGYREYGERHLVPPKTTHDHAELHGMFDDALDKTGAAQQKAREDVFAWSRLESGTLFDGDIINVADQWGVRIPQKVALRHDPAAVRRPLKDIAALDPGEAPASGQYLVIDQDTLTLPYLPDPLADGISLRFTDAGAQRSLFFARPSEGFTARFPGAWPSRTPFLLRLTAGSALRTEVDGHTVSLHVPAGETVKMRLSSSIVRDRIGELGPWRQLEAGGGPNPLLKEEAIDGRLWVCSPSEAIVLVHATPRPMERPRWVDEDPRVDRDPGSTEAFLEAGIDVHGPSTESLTAELEWSDLVDDLAFPAPQTRPHVQIGFTSPLAAWEDTAVLCRIDAAIPVPELGLVGLHRARHVFEDTKHHEVAYRLRATTRFREYFPPGALAPDGSPGDDGLSVLSEVRTLHVPSTASPPPPVIHSVLPLFRWNRGSEPHQPAAWRHTRLSGVRVYLERPWNGSGDGELMAVLLAPAGFKDSAPDGRGLYSQWGSDPIWPETTVGTRMLFGLSLDHFLRLANVDDRERAGRPVLDPVTLGGGASSLAAAAPASVTLLAYQPQFSEERRLWYVDIAFDTTTEFWPFVRLSLARYQPHSLPGAELSTPVRADFVQLVPPRETVASRTDERHVRVLTSGPMAYRPKDSERGGVPVPDPSAAPWMTGGVAMTAFPPLAGRLLVARLQTRDPEIGGDLGWRTVHTQEMVPLGISHVPSGLTWGAELAADEDIVLRTPAETASAWRVTVEEWERFPGDPPPTSTARRPQPPVWEQRLIYADEIHL